MTRSPSCTMGGGTLNQLCRHVRQLVCPQGTRLRARVRVKMNKLHIRRDWNIRVRFLHLFKTDLALSKVLEGLKRLEIRINDLRHMFRSVLITLNSYKAVLMPPTLSLAASSARSVVSSSTTLSLARGLSSSTCSSLTELGVGRATGDGDLGLSTWISTCVEARSSRRTFRLRRVNSSALLLFLAVRCVREGAANIPASSNTSVSSSLRFFAGRAPGDGAETCGGCPSIESARLLPLRDTERVDGMFSQKFRQGLTRSQER